MEWVLGMTSDAMRKRREEACAEIRKAKRYDDLNKRRQIDLAPADEDEEPGREPVRFYVLTLKKIFCRTVHKLCLFDIKV